MNKIFLVLMCMVLVSAGFVFAASTSAIVKVSLLNQDPNPARAGDTVNLRFKIENTGGEAVSNFQMEIIQDYPFTVVDNEPVKSIDTLDPYQTGKNYINTESTIKIDKDAVQGQKQLNIRYKYGSNDWITMGFSINVVSKEFAQIIYVDKALVEPGIETEMKFTINNIGNAPLQNMLFSWSEPNGVILPVYSSDTKYVKYLDVGESVDLVYTVIADVNAKPGLYQLNLNLKSESTSNATANTITTKAGIFIGGQTDFDVAFSESSAGQTSLSVSNTGNNPAQSVSVKIPNQQSFRVTGTNSAIIGNLDKGDYTIVSFQIVQAGSMNLSNQGSGQRRQQNSQGSQIPSRANISNQDSQMQFRVNASSNPNNLLVGIDYTDTTGQRRSVEKTVPIQFRSASTTTATTTNRAGTRSSSSVSWVGILIILLIVCVGLWVFWKKQRRDKVLSFFHTKK